MTLPTVAVKTPLLFTSTKTLPQLLQVLAALVRRGTPLQQLMLTPGDIKPTVASFCIEKNYRLVIT